MTETEYLKDNLQRRDRCAAFLNRATFGALPDEVTQLQHMGFSAWFDDQTNLPTEHHLPELKRIIEINQLERASSHHRLGVWLQRAITGKDQLRQKMAYALSQIFVLSQKGVGNRQPELCTYYDLLLDHSFSTFADVLRAVSTNALMGRYLTLRGSAKANPKKNTFPDENYAREVMQLFSIGLWKLDITGEPKLDAQGNKIPTYHQKDVQELARVLTGWREGDTPNVMYSRSRDHDKDEKVVMGHVFPAGQSGEADLEQMVQLLSRHGNTAPFISKLLIQRLVTSNPAPSYVGRVAKVFLDNGQGVRGDLKAVLFAVLTDPHVFRGVGAAPENGKPRRNTFGRIKEPAILLVNQARALGMKSIDAHWVDYPRMESNFGQAPLCANTVFNFYLPDYSPKGILGDLHLSSPESMLLSPFQMQRIHNRLVNNIDMANNQKPQRWTYDPTPFLNVIDDVPAFIELTNERIFSGAMPKRIKHNLQRLLIEKVPTRDPLQRVRIGLYLIFTSPEYACHGALV